MSFKRNLYALFGIRVAMWFMVLMPVIIPFFQSQGLALHQVIALTSIHSLCIAFLELPSGFLADRWGHRNMFVLGGGFFALGYLGFCMANGFWGFALAQLSLGTANAFISGSDSALLYHSLKTEKASDSFMLWEGKNYGIGSMAEAIAALLGGFLATHSLDYPLWIQTGIACLVLPFALMLKPVPNHLQEKNRWKHFSTALNQGLNPKGGLLPLMLLSALAGVATLGMAWLSQGIFESLQLPLKWFGWLWAGLNLATAYTAYFSGKWQSKPKAKHLETISLLGLGVIPIFMGYSQGYFILIGLVLHYLCRGYSTPWLRQKIVQLAPDDSQATLMSLRSLIIRLAYGGFALVLSLWIDNYGLLGSLTRLGNGLSIGIILVLAWHFRQAKKGA